ncbi:MAG TPA: hypothetical protein VN048_17420 [Verrucomicrobiae bacterium]|nr:hypothetical protein [Verrucomicrobiae bacterium]
MEPSIDLGNLLALLGNECGGRLGGGAFLFLNQFQHAVRPIRPERIRMQECGDFNIKGFFADIRLRAAHRLVFLGAAVVGVTFLDFGSHAASAAATAKKADEGLRDGGRCAWRPPPAAVQDSVSLVKEGFGDDGLVRALMHLPIVGEMAVVDGIREEMRDKAASDFVPVPRANAAVGQELPQRVERFRAGGVAFKGQLHQRGAFAVNDDLLGAVIVQIAERGGTGEFAAPDFLAQAPLGVLGE